MSEYPVFKSVTKLTVGVFAYIGLLAAISGVPKWWREIKEEYRGR